MEKEWEAAEVNEQLEVLAKEIAELNASYDFAFEDIFPKSFMLNYTNASSIENFLLNSPYDISTQEEVNQLPIDALDAYVYDNTPFPSWKTMYTKASKIYIAERLGLA